MNFITYVVALPPETQVALAGLVGLVVMVVFNYIGTQLPWSVPFLSKYKDEISAALSGVFIGWLSNVLPGDKWAGVSIAGVNFFIALVVAVLGYGALHLVRMILIKTSKEVPPAI